MSGWPLVRLSEVLTDAEVGFACGKNRHVPVGVAHLRPFNIGNDLDLRLDQVYRVPDTEAPEGKVGLVAGDVLFNNTNSADQVGKVAYVGRELEAGFSNHVTRLRFRSNQIEPAFAAAVLHRLWRRRYFEQRCTRWVSQAAFNTKALQELEIPLPPLDEQRRIVDILNRANGIRRLRREALGKTRQLIPALFINMFGDPATNPKGWLERPFDELISYSRYGPRFHDRDYSPIGTRVLRTTDISFFGSIDWQKSPRLAVSDEELSRYALKPNTLLFTRTGATIGKCALFSGAPEPCIAGAYLIECGLSDAVVGSYVLAFFSSARGQALLLRGSRAVAQPNINVPTIRGVRLPLAPLALQAAFASRVADIQATISRQERMAEVSDHLVADLMAQLLNR